MEVERITYTTKEVSQILGIGINKTRKLINRKDFPKITYGRNWIIPKKEFEEWLSRNIGKDLR